MYRPPPITWARLPAPWIWAAHIVGVRPMRRVFPSNADLIRCDAGLGRGKCLVRRSRVVGGEGRGSAPARSRRSSILWLSLTSRARTLPGSSCHAPPNRWRASFTSCNASMKSSGVGSSSSLLDSIRILLISEAAPAGGVWSNQQRFDEEGTAARTWFQVFSQSRPVGVRARKFGPENCRRALFGSTRDRRSPAS